MINNISDTLLAKSNPKESLSEHTSHLHTNLMALRPYINPILFEKFELFLTKLIYYHDLGKGNTKFQNKLKKSLNLPLDIEHKELINSVEIPHELLSIAFISKEDKVFFESFDYDALSFFELARFCIAFHHTRKEILYDTLDVSTIQHHIDYDLEPRKWLLGLSHPLRKAVHIRDIQNKIIRNKETFDTYFPYLVFLKGLLHKCDYTASGHSLPEISYTPVQPNSTGYRSDFDYWLSEKGITLHPFQREATAHSHKSCVLIASTGAGKTEYAMNWIDGQKAFYLLGIRIAVNEMYKRFQVIFGNKNMDSEESNVCLLHGDSGSFLLEEEDIQDKQDFDAKLSKAKNLSFPLTIATADQLVPAVFKYNSFELLYFTLSYSKVVVDEIQSFSPKSIAAIVVFLKEIHTLGGKFLLMTATLPRFIQKEFEGNEFKNEIHFPEPALSPMKRHRFTLVEERIDSEAAIQHIIKTAQDKRVLVICNTVKMAQSVYDQLLNSHINTHLLHSRFIGKDKKEKEHHIMNIPQSGQVVWVSTQVVEASLDLDFDCLITELSTIDSLFQRFGRCYRKREYYESDPNIYIYTSGNLSSYIYDKDLLSWTKDTIQQYKNKLLTEQDKQDMISKVFDHKHFDSSAYYEEYKNRKALLELGFKSLKSEAQDAFREITNTYSVIPIDVYNTYKEAIHSLLLDIESSATNPLDKMKYISNLKTYMVPVQLFGKQQDNLIKELSPDVSHTRYCKRNRVRVLYGCSYTYEKGVVMDKTKESIGLDERMI